MLSNRIKLHQESKKHLTSRESKTYGAVTQGKKSTKEIVRRSETVLQQNTETGKGNLQQTETQRITKLEDAKKLIM
jgi:hypothetical protein